MYYFRGSEGRKFIEDKCIEIVEKGIVYECKHSTDIAGVACFYLNCDDTETHKKVIGFFLENKMIRKTKTGKLFNISFKLNKQTRKMEYGNNYSSEIKLDQFIDLTTGEFII